MMFSRPHSNKFNLASSCTAHFLPSYVIFSETNMTALLNLLMTDITLSKHSERLKTDKPSMKLMKMM